MELAQGRQQHHPGRRRVHAVLAQGARDLVAQGLGTLVEVIAVVQRQGSETVVPEQGAGAVQFVQLVQVQGEHVQPVVEGVPDAVESFMTQCPDVDARVHQPLLRLSTASWAERTASSWKP